MSEEQQIKKIKKRISEVLEQKRKAERVKSRGYKSLKNSFRESFSKKLRKCVICGEEFQIRAESVSARKVCYRHECIKKYRYFCGIGNRYWNANSN